MIFDVIFMFAKAAGEIYCCYLENAYINLQSKEACDQYISICIQNGINPIQYLIDEQINKQNNIFKFQKSIIIAGLTVSTILLISAYFFPNVTPGPTFIAALPIPVEYLPENQVLDIPISPTAPAA